MTPQRGDSPVGEKRAELDAAKQRLQAAVDHEVGGSSKRISFVERNDAALRRTAEGYRDVAKAEQALKVEEYRERESNRPRTLDIEGLEPGDAILLKGNIAYRVLKVNKSTVKVKVPPGMDDLIPKSKIIQTQKAKRGETDTEVATAADALSWPDVRAMSDDERSALRAKLNAILDNPSLDVEHLENKARARRAIATMSNAVKVTPQAGKPNFTALDRARIQAAAEDYAAANHGGALNLSRDDTARYVTEGHLQTLENKYGTSAVQDAVRAYIDAHPEVLTGARDGGRGNEAARKAISTATAERARLAMKEKDFDGALAAVNEGEAKNPDFTVNGITWDAMRERIEDRRKNHDAVMAAAPPPARPLDTSRVNMEDEGATPPTTTEASMTTPARTVASLAAERDMSVARFRKLTGDTFDSYDDGDNIQDDRQLDLIDSALPLPVPDVTPAAKPATPGEPSLGVTESAKGRTTTITLPDGTTAKRTSKTMAYTHAVVMTTDKRAEARDDRAEADERARYIDALKAWMDAGADVSKLKAYPSRTLSYADKQAGRSAKEYYLPGFEPEKKTAPRRNGFGGHDYWSDTKSYSLPDPKDTERLSYRDNQTSWEAYGPEYQLQQQRERIENLRTRADKLDAGPAETYGVVRWSQSLSGAMGGSNEFSQMRNTRTQIIGVGGVAKAPGKPAKVVPTAEEKAAAKAAAAETEKADRAARDEKWADQKIEWVRDQSEANAADLGGVSPKGLVLIAERVGVKVPRKLADRGPEFKQAVLDAIRKPAAPAAPTPASVDRVQAAYAQVLARQSDAGTNRWIGIADLRDELAGTMTRAEVDAVLLELSSANDRGARVIPVANRKALTQRDRDAAITIGGETNEAISFAAPAPAAPVDPPNTRSVTDPSGEVFRWPTDKGVTIDITFEETYGPDKGRATGLGFIPGSGIVGAGGEGDRNFLVTREAGSTVWQANELPDGGGPIAGRDVATLAKRVAQRHGITAGPIIIEDERREERTGKPQGARIDLGPPPAPAGPPPIRWVDRATGDPVANPTQVDIVRGFVVREEQRVPAPGMSQTPAAVAQSLNTASSHAEGRAILARRRRHELEAVARELGVPITSDDSKLREAIIEKAVTGRLRPPAVAGTDVEVRDGRIIGAGGSAVPARNVEVIERITSARTRDLAVSYLRGASIKSLKQLADDPAVGVVYSSKVTREELVESILRRLWQASANAAAVDRVVNRPKA